MRGVKRESRGRGGGIGRVRGKRGGRAVGGRV